MIGEYIHIDEEIQLTRFNAEDLGRLVLYINDKGIYDNTLQIPHPYREEHARDFLNSIEQYESLNGKVKDWAVRWNGSLVGGIGLMYNYGHDSHKSEFGYWLARPFWNRGLMTRIISGFCSWVWENTGIVRLEAMIYLTNPASMRVVEKVGF